MKNQNKQIVLILIIACDFAGNPSFTRQSQLLHATYTTGRHNMISMSTATATQKNSAVHATTRVSLVNYRSTD